MKRPVDLRLCSVGDRLLTCHGAILVYRGRSQNKTYPHAIEYPDGSYGSRTDDGFVMSNPAMRLPSDHDVIEVWAKRAWQIGGGNSRARRLRRRAYERGTI